MAVSAIGPVINPEIGIPIEPAPRPAERGGLSFADLLRQVIATDASAQQAVDTYAIGQQQNLHETMIALEKTDISLTLLVNVRNKLLDAYREVMRMS